jgi:hypothetical protein
MTMDHEPWRRPSPGGRLGGVLLLLALDGLLALGLLFAVGLDEIAVSGFKPGPPTRTEFSTWIIIFACWIALMAAPAVILGERRPEFVVVQVLIGVTVLAFWFPTVSAGWHALHVPPASSTYLPVAPRHCTGHPGNPCPGG